MSPSAAFERASSSVGDVAAHEDLPIFEADNLESTALAPLANPETLPTLYVAIIGLFTKYASITDPM